MQHVRHGVATCDLVTILDPPRKPPEGHADQCSPRYLVLSSCLALKSGTGQSVLVPTSILQAADALSLVDA